jgi:uncharacterized protein YndB with AHSA1/START domain
MVYVKAEATIGAPAARVWTLITDFHQHHQKFLPSSFEDFKVEEGGLGAGTIFSFTSHAARRTRHFRMRVDEPEPGRVMTESDLTSTMVTRWTLTPMGQQTLLTIETRWKGAGGIKGFFEGLFAPPAMRRIYADELRRLDQYARSQVAAG